MSVWLPCLQDRGKQVLDEIASTYAVEWKIIDNELVVTDRYSLKWWRTRESLFCPRTTGLLDIPATDSEEASKGYGDNTG